MMTPFCGLNTKKRKQVADYECQCDASKAEKQSWELIVLLNQNKNQILVLVSENFSNVISFLFF